ncbi:hypothetical protein ETB97_009874 [Aspergillus alliaceus]|uniref:Major facilitator superfamily (MFS) profile domain-containing protein n=1 Tax=Petromyces alliaceus TaxID=209559 RepID=A0A8H6EBL9_PETAA|nr:hypothetical protein ETB97_009874 [Aspergillus burnettii]
MSQPSMTSDAISACGASMLFSFDMGVIGGVPTMNSFKQQYGLLGKQVTVLANLGSTIVSSIQAGYFLGALVSTYIANSIRRQWSLILAALVLFVGGALQAGASVILGVFIYKFIGRLSISIASSVFPIYIAENAPRGIRGLGTGFYQLALVFGLANYMAVIIPLSLQTYPAVILWVGMLLATSRFDISRCSNPDKAPRVLGQLRNLPAEDHSYVMEAQHSLSSTGLS